MLGVAFLTKVVGLVSGSDYPIELANPFHGIHAAVTRQDKANQPEQWLDTGAKRLP